MAYPSVELVLAFHGQIVVESGSTESGVRSKDAIESTLQYVSEDFFGEVPETLHGKVIAVLKDTGL
ncbi:hypothetical protein [Haladaptatus litoreus]|uniref:hypothetical protein n=1 Tax=Haladaptatus litoreus TaxID=553468 RepID=UPI000970934C|nr:hypothetical protein [Haladaptatus litoreus]